MDRRPLQLVSAEGASTNLLLLSVRAPGFAIAEHMDTATADTQNPDGANRFAPTGGYCVGDNGYTSLYTEASRATYGRGTELERRQSNPVQCRPLFSSLS